VDQAHSSVGFEVKHMMIATVRGRFNEFEGTIEAAEDIDNSRVYGKVRTASIDCIRRPVELDSTVEGAERDPWGNERVGIRVRGQIDRREFGLTWQKMLESGGFLVGDEVKILVDVSAVKAT
jgi:polyisoprenoid-binding protein YceI